MATKSRRNHVEATRLIAMLSEAIGEQKAEAAVREQLDKLQYGETLTHDQALFVLENLAGGTGIVAAVARFAKVRILLEQNRGLRNGTGEWTIDRASSVGDDE